jgi:5-methylcytosine-specific restriction endonuclease McrA
MGIQNYPALVLNADFRPLSYLPSWEMRLPSVISLKEYVPMARRPAFTRYNVFLRDRFTCQYCRQPSPAEELTFDHVIPRSRGGRTSWDNVVAACTGCNLQKGNRMPRESGIVPVRKPQEPSNFELQENGRAFPPNFLHESWRDFLYWDTELEIA